MNDIEGRLEPALVLPDEAKLSGFEAALILGWSPDPRRAHDASFMTAEIQKLREDRLLYLQKHLRTHTDPDGETDGRVAALVCHRFWICDGEFCGTIELRYLPATGTVPDDVPGHVGYSIVPWKQRKGYGTRALELLLEFAARQGLNEIDILCNAENLASKAVIERVGGELHKCAPHSSDRPDQQKLHFRVHVS